MWVKNRSMEQEILDLGPDHYSENEYRECLEILGKINSITGGFRATKKALKKLKISPKSILEIGCGGGYLCQKLHKWYPEANILGVDLAEKAIQHSVENCPETSKKRVSFDVQADKNLNYSENSFDIVTTILVTHHMTDNELISFIEQTCKIAKEAVIINDLHRHPLAYLSYSLFTPLIFPNRLIIHDGKLSIKRSFTKSDWIELLNQAKIPKDQYTINWNFPFRWTITIRKK